MESAEIKPETQSKVLFSDVPAEAEYSEAVAWCNENNILNGVGDGRFSPDGTLTRAMLATALFRAAGEPGFDAQPHFSDAVAGAWYCNAAIAWADANGYMKGYGNHIFGTTDPVSVEHLEVIMGRYTGDGPEWTGDQSKAHAATHAQVAVALYTALKDKSYEPVKKAVKTLVAYFSATNTTRPFAEYVADIQNTDIYEIVPEVPYTDADLAYYSDCRADR